MIRPKEDVIQSIQARFKPFIINRTAKALAELINLLIELETGISGNNRVEKHHHEQLKNCVLTNNTILHRLNKFYSETTLESFNIDSFLKYINEEQTTIS